MTGYLFLAILLFFAHRILCRRSAGNGFVTANGSQVHSRPIYHGAFAADLGRRAGR